MASMSSRGRSQDSRLLLLYKRASFGISLTSYRRQIWKRWRHYLPWSRNKVNLSKFLITSTNPSSSLRKSNKNRWMKISCSFFKILAPWEKHLSNLGMLQTTYLISKNSKNSYNSLNCKQNFSGKNSFAYFLRPLWKEYIFRVRNPTHKYFLAIRISASTICFWSKRKKSRG